MGCVMESLAALIGFIFGFAGCAIINRIASNDSPKNQENPQSLAHDTISYYSFCLSDVLDALNEQCGEEWTSKSLEGFTLAATVTRAIRWHKDTVSELKHAIECDKRYIGMLESVALSYSNALAGQTQPTEGESVRDFLERRYYI